MTVREPDGWSLALSLAAIGLFAYGVWIAPAWVQAFSGALVTWGIVAIRETSRSEKP